MQTRKNEKAPTIINTSTNDKVEPFVSLAVVVGNSLGRIVGSHTISLILIAIKIIITTIR